MDSVMSNTNNNASISASGINTNTGVHCKVFFNGQFRRFQLAPKSDGDEAQYAAYDYKSFRGHVESLLALSSNFLLKYQDNESDYITISSDEELSYAISILKTGEIFRLFAIEDPVVPMHPPMPPYPTPPGLFPPGGNAFPFAPPHPSSAYPPGAMGPFPFPPHQPPEAFGGGRCGHGRHREHPYSGPGGRRGGGGCGRGGHHHHGPHGGRGHYSEADGPAWTGADWGAFKKEKIQSKIAILESLLADSSDDERGKEKLEKRIAKLKTKLDRIENRKSKYDNMDAESTSNSRSPLWSSIKNKKVAIKQAEADGNTELVEKLTNELKALRLEKRELKGELKERKQKK